MARTAMDRIEKVVVLRAPIERVWRAVSDADQFGRWFGARFEGAFEPGARVGATIQPTEVDQEIADKQAPYAGTPFDIIVERVDPPRLLSFRWQPGGEPDTTDDAARTLVEFELEAVDEGTRLTIRESGFDRIALEQRARAFEDNAQGWEMQATLVGRFVERNP